MLQSDAERRLLTVLFADLSGFTALSSSLMPEEVSEIANTGFEFLNKPIIAHGGTIHKYEGDLVIALFGHPTTHEDDPERAIKAALEMMGQVDKINEALSKKLRMETDLGLHIGINSGVVYVGEIGSAEKKEYTVMGHVVNLTSRLKDVAKRGEVVVAESVFRASRYLFDYDAGVQVAVKGVAEPVRVFKLLGIRREPEPKRGISGLYSPMIGRDAELLALERAVDRLEQEGESFVCFVLGDPGLGKSRLLSELENYIEEKGIELTVLKGKGFVYGENVPYLPFLHILGSLFKIEQNDSPDESRAKIIGYTKKSFPDTWFEIAPYIAYLFSLRFTDELDERVKYLNEQGLKTQIRLSVKGLLENIARHRPVLFVVDDYHWIDSESLELLESLLSAPMPERMMFLGLSRIEKDRQCFKTKEKLKNRLGGVFREIVLTPLSESDASRLVYNLLKIPSITEDFKNKVLAQTGGNPFFAEEIIRSSIDSGFLVYRDGVWKLTAEIPGFKPPESVQAVIAARYDRLEKEMKKILQVASVIGRSFSERVLEQVCGIDSLMLIHRLATLEDNGFIRRSPSVNDMEYIFWHPLISEVVYDTLIKKDRNDLHRQVGLVIEKLFPERIDELTELLAYHYGNSDDALKSLEWSLKAGEKTESMFAHDKALKYYKSVIALVKDGLTGDTDDLLEAYEKAGDILIRMGKLDDAIQYYESMHGLALRGSVIQARAKRKIAHVMQKQEKYCEAAEILSVAESILDANTSEETVERVLISDVRGKIKRERGAVKESIADGEHSLGIINELMNKNADSGVETRSLNQVKVDILNNIAVCWSYLNESEKAIKLYSEMIDIARQFGLRRSIIAAQTNLAIIYANLDDHERALAELLSNLEQSREIGDMIMSLIIIRNISVEYLIVGDYEKAKDYTDLTMKMSIEIGDNNTRYLSFNNLGVISLYRGDYKMAIEHFEMARQNTAILGQADAMTGLARVYHLRGEYQKSMALYENALQIYEDVNDKMYINQTMTLLVEHFRVVGDNIKAMESCRHLLERLEDMSSNGVAQTYIAYTRVLVDAGDLEKAEQCLLKAEKIAVQNNVKPVRVELYTVFAQARIAGLRDKKDPDQGQIDLIKGDLAKAAQYAREMGSKYYQAYGYFLHGKLYALLDDFENAGTNLGKAIDIWKTIGCMKMLPEALFESARLLMKKEKTGVPAGKAADDYFNQALAIYQDQNLTHKMKQIEQARGL